MTAGIQDDSLAAPPPDAARGRPDARRRAGLSAARGPRLLADAGRIAATVLGQLLVRARFRLSMVAVLTIFLWSALFWIFCDAFRFLNNVVPAPDLHDETVQIVFGAFFMTLMVMLVFSAGIILYSTLFKGQDIPLLLTLPARAERIFLNKLQEAILMSSWAFLLLGSPMLLAYGIVNDAPWYYFAMLVPFLVAFTYVPAGLGALVCLVVVYWLPSLRWHVVALAGILLMLVGIAVGWSLVSGPEGNLLTARWFQDMLDRLRVTQHRLLPSWWLSAGLFQAARQNPRESMLFLGPDDLQRPVLPPAGDLDGRRLVPQGVQPPARPPHRRGKSAKASWIDRLAFRLSPFACRGRAGS